MNRGRAHLPLTRRRQYGGAAIEYVVVVGALLAVLAFGGPTVSELLKALHDAWTSFLHALSISWI